MSFASLMLAFAPALAARFEKPKPLIPVHEPEPTPAEPDALSRMSYEQMEAQVAQFMASGQIMQAYRQAQAWARARHRANGYGDETWAGAKAKVYGEANWRCECSPSRSAALRGAWVQP